MIPPNYIPPFTIYVPNPWYAFAPFGGGTPSWTPKLAIDLWLCSYIDSEVDKIFFFFFRWRASGEDMNRASYQEKRRTLVSNGTFFFSFFQPVRPHHPSLSIPTPDDHEQEARLKAQVEDLSRQLQECQSQRRPIKLRQTRKRPASQAYTEALGIKRESADEGGWRNPRRRRGPRGKGRVGQDAGNWSSKQAGW